MGSRSATVVLLAATAAGCGDDLPAPCGGDRYAVCGNQLLDAQRRSVVLRGVNFAGSHKQAPYTDPFLPADYAQLHAWGFRTLRFLVTWSAIEPVQGTYDDAYLDWVAERMQWASAAGLTVVLDMHQDVYGEGFGFDGAPRWTCDESHYAAFVPNENWILNYADPNLQACYDHLWHDAALQDQFAAMWGHVAERLASEPAIIGFDPLNEPHWGSLPVPTFEVDYLQPFYAKAIAAIRAHAPWVAFAEPAASRNLGLASKLAPFDVPDVVYSPHMYDPTAELHGEFDAMRRDALLSTAMDLRADADRLGLPLWIGEYGGIATSPQIGAYMDAAYDGAAAAFGSSMYWAFDRGGGYSMLDADGTPRAPLLDAIVRPYPSAVAGTLQGWDYDDATRTLQVRWAADPSVRAPTVIVVPDRAYPGGYDVACGGCAVVRGDGEFTVVGGDDSVTVTAR